MNRINPGGYTFTQHVAFGTSRFSFFSRVVVAFEKDVNESLQDFHERLLKLPSSFRPF
jgi:hypothetical protein